MHALFARLTARAELTTLAAILLCVCGIWAFAAIASEMVQGDLTAFDETILLALRTPGQPDNPIGGPEVEIALRDMTALGGVTVLGLITIAVFTALMLLRQRGSAYVLLAAVAGGQLLSHLAKSAFARPRPDLVAHGVDVSSASFPSGHSMMAACTYLTLAVMLARIEPNLRMKVFYLGLATLLTVLVGVSRVYLGVHWPSDVLAGWAAGAAWALACYLVALRLGHKHAIEPEREAR